MLAVAAGSSGPDDRDGTLGDGAERRVAQHPQHQRCVRAGHSGRGGPGEREHPPRGPIVVVRGDQATAQRSQELQIVRGAVEVVAGLGASADHVRQCTPVTDCPHDRLGAVLDHQRSERCTGPLDHPGQVGPRPTAIVVRSRRHAALRSRNSRAAATSLHSGRSWPRRSARVHATRSARSAPRAVISPLRRPFSSGTSAARSNRNR